jgi:RNA polymerase sigma factor (sigma-70 family)
VHGANNPRHFAVLVRRTKKSHDLVPGPRARVSNPSSSHGTDSAPETMSSNDDAPESANRMRAQTSDCLAEPPPAALSALDIEAAYRAHGHLVLRRAQALLHDETEAQEVLQEVFMTLLREPAVYGGRSAMTTWLYRVTTNMCLNRLRNDRTRQRLLDEHVAPAVHDAVQESADTWATARQFLDRMPEDLARVTIFYSIDGMTHHEIAEVMGCSRRQVGNLLERARAWACSQEAE